MKLTTTSLLVACLAGTSIAAPLDRQAKDDLRKGMFNERQLQLLQLLSTYSTELGLDAKNTEVIDELLKINDGGSPTDDLGALPGGPGALGSKPADPAASLSPTPTPTPAAAVPVTTPAAAAPTAPAVAAPAPGKMRRRNEDGEDEFAYLYSDLMDADIGFEERTGPVADAMKMTHRISRRDDSDDALFIDLPNGIFRVGKGAANAGASGNAGATGSTSVPSTGGGSSTGVVGSIGGALGGTPGAGSIGGATGVGASAGVGASSGVGSSTGVGAAPAVGASSGGDAGVVTAVGGAPGAATGGAPSVGTGVGAVGGSGMPSVGGTPTTGGGSSTGNAGSIDAGLDRDTRDMKMRRRRNHHIVGPVDLGKAGDRYIGETTGLTDGSPGSAGGTYN